MNTWLNIADMAEGVRPLGPGSRVVIWLQGCQQNCPGCISQEYRPIEPRLLITGDELVKHLKKHGQDHSGLTLSGGEPLLQAGALLYVWDQIKLHFPEWNLILFSGYTKKQIDMENHSSKQLLVGKCDAFIDGVYNPNHPSDRGLKGSENQQIYFPPYSLFTEDEKGEILNKQNARQLIVTPKSVLLAGIPTNTEYHNSFQQ